MAPHPSYYEMLVEAYSELVTPEVAAARGPVLVDGACGIGAPKLEALQRR